MRRYYLDNVRWMTIVSVVVYHVIYMYNSIATEGVIGPFSEKQYQDGLQYILYPWFMILLFIVAGMHYLPLSATAYFLHKYTDLSAFPSYILAAIAAFSGSLILYEA